MKMTSLALAVLAITAAPAFAQSNPPPSLPTPAVSLPAPPSGSPTVPSPEGGNVKGSANGSITSTGKDGSATLSGNGDGKSGTISRDKPLDGLRNSEMNAGGKLKTSTPDGNGGTTDRTYSSNVGVKDGKASVSASTPDRDFNINTGSENSLRENLGVSNAEAKSIREFREKNGNITSRAQLDRVQGLSRESRDRIAQRLNLASR